MAIELLHPSNTIVVDDAATNANLTLTPKGTGTVVTSAAFTASTITSTGNLVSSNSAGDEGGEIQLAKPQTNTTLDGTGVVIDVRQNRLRIFEQGGSNRGVYLDLTSAAINSGTNLLAGGGGTGTVTSVGGTGTVSGLTLSGTVTTSGNLTLGGTLSVAPSNFSSQTANTVLAAPNGSAGVPTFRTLVAADIPTLNQSTTGSAASLTTGRTISITGDLAYTSPSFDGSGNVTAAGTLATVNSNVGTFTNASVTVNAKGLVTAVSSGSAGTVTSVGGTGTVSGLTLSGTVTTTGNLTLGGTLSVAASNFSSQTANTVLVAPNGTAGVPTFRALVAADLPTLNQNTTGTASNVTGTVAIANGGSGATTAQLAMNAFAGAVTSGSYLRGNGTNVVMSTIQAADVPTLNQNTTGSAATATTLTGTTTANIPTSALATGTADATTYLRGDRTWVAFSGGVQLFEVLRAVSLRL